MTPAPSVFPLLQAIGAGLGTFVLPHRALAWARGRRCGSQGCRAGLCLPMRNSSGVKPALMMEKTVMPEELVPELGKYLVFSFAGRSKI